MVNEDYGEFFTDRQVASLLGYNPVSLRRWRVKNKLAGAIVYGPPYVLRASRVLYPKQLFWQWCSKVKVEGGVPKMNLPVTADPHLVEELEQLSTVKEVADEPAE